MALNKSKSNLWLGIHCLVYAGFFLFISVLFNFKSPYTFSLLVGISHFIVDWITSRGTTKLWLMNERHWFFCLIGLDQSIHLISLFLLLKWFGV
jgi:membrane-bound metal-dependent hydrolase YbcI (DUF457 family)